MASPFFQAKVPGTSVAPPLKVMSISFFPTEPDAVGFVLMVGVAFWISTSTNAGAMPV